MTKEELARLLSVENTPALASSLDVLDDRELEVFSALGQGYSGRQLESLLGIDARQLSGLKRSIESKLKLKSDLELLRSAVKHNRAG